MKREKKKNQRLPVLKEISVCQILVWLTKQSYNHIILILENDSSSYAAFTEIT